MFKLWLIKVITTVSFISIIESLAPEGKTRVLINVLFSLALLTILVEPIQMLINAENIGEIFSYYAYRGFSVIY